MVIKKTLFFTVILLIVTIIKAHELPLKPLYAPTIFSSTLDHVMSIWNKSSQKSNEIKLQEQLEALSALLSLLAYQKKMVHTGNIEYVLSIFDSLEANIAQNQLLVMIHSIKKKLIELL